MDKDKTQSSQHFAFKTPEKSVPDWVERQESTQYSLEDKSFSSSYSAG